MDTPLIVIIGPTASGKTALAVQAALEVGGEIICADSRTVYQGLTVGTAKPSADERATVPHHLLDIVAPDTVFTAADFQRLAERTVSDIKARGRVSFVVGGSGLYIDGLVYGYNFGSPVTPEERAKWQAMSLEDLQQHCLRSDIPLPENTRNKRYVIRAIEQRGINQQRERTKKFNAMLIGLRQEREVLRGRIAARAETIFNSCVVEEALKTAKRYGWDSQAMTGNIYPILRRYCEGKISLAEAKQQFITADMRLAKRQMTWFKRNPDIEWFDDAGAACRTIIQRLAK